MPVLALARKPACVRKPTCQAEPSRRQTSTTVLLILSRRLTIKDSWSLAPSTLHAPNQRLHRLTGSGRAHSSVQNANFCDSPEVRSSHPSFSTDLCTFMLKSVTRYS